MKNTNIMNRMGGTLHKIGFQLKKHSPEILIVAGVVGVVASTVMACKATTKASKVVEKAKDDINEIHKAAEKGVTNAGEAYSEEDSGKDLTTVYAKTGVELLKLYAPAVALGALSLTSIITSNQILRKRNVALAAAYATVDRSFKDYRSRVIERFGEKVDKELKYNIQKKEVEETVTDENGKEKVVKKTIEVASINEGSQYARWFDRNSREFTDNHDYNLCFLMNVQRQANDLLISRGKGGRVFLNEVYDMLDIPRSKAGQVVGWIYDPDLVTVDSYIDFGIHDSWRENARDFINEYSEYILLDFNVDGNVWDDM